MPASVSVDFSGPDICLGCATVVTPGTPVQFTFAIDPTGLLYAPEVSNRSSGKLFPPLRFQQIILQAMIPDTHGMKDNTGNVYIVRRGGSRDDPGLMVMVIKKGVTVFLASAPRIGDTFNPYRYWVDADNAGDGLLITGLTQG